MVKHGKTWQNQEIPRRFRDDSETLQVGSDMAMCETVRTARGEADPFAAQLGLLPGWVFLAYRSGAATCSWFSYSGYSFVYREIAILFGEMMIMMKYGVGYPNSTSIWVLQTCHYPH